MKLILIKLILMILILFKLIFIPNFFILNFQFNNSELGTAQPQLVSIKYDLPKNIIIFKNFVNNIIDFV